MRLVFRIGDAARSGYRRKCSKGEHDVDDRVKTTTARTATIARTRAESEAGPFGGVPTKVADSESLRSLIEATAAQNETVGDDRKTREVDPAEFRALLRQEEQLAPASAASRTEPAQPATFDDALDAAFADPDVGAAAASPSTTPAKGHTGTEQRVEVPPGPAVHEALERPTATTPARSSAYMFVVGVALLIAIAAVVGVLVVALA